MSKATPFFFVFFFACVQPLQQIQCYGNTFWNLILPVFATRYGAHRVWRSRERKLQCRDRGQYPTGRPWRFVQSEFLQVMGTSTINFHAICLLFLSDITPWIPLTANLECRAGQAVPEYSECKKCAWQCVTWAQHAVDAVTVVTVETARMQIGRTFPQEAVHREWFTTFVRHGCCPLSHSGASSMCNKSWEAERELPWHHEDGFRHGRSSC